MDRADYPTCDQILTDPDRVNVSTPCRCGGSDHLVLATRLETRPWGGYSLAGAVTKYTPPNLSPTPRAQHAATSQGTSTPTS